MATRTAKFQPGQIVHHRLFDYLGVIFDIDPDFRGTDEWYEHVARSRPPRDEPWYHVLVHDAEHTTYYEYDPLGRLIWRNDVGPCRAMRY